MYKEKLSSLIDGELVDNELISQLSSDQDMQKDWHSYHIIRDTLRGQVHQSTISLDIAENIAIALEQEPTKLAPQRELESQPLPETWQKMPFWTKIRNKVSPLVSQLGQISIAACTTLIIIGAVQQYNQPATDSIESPVFNTIPINNNVSPVSFNTSIMQERNQAAEREQLERIRAMLQDYELQRRLHSVQ